MVLVRLAKQDKVNIFGNDVEVESSPFVMAVALRRTCRVNRGVSAIWRRKYMVHAAGMAEKASTMRHV